MPWAMLLLVALHGRWCLLRSPFFFLISSASPWQIPLRWCLWHACSMSSLTPSWGLWPTVPSRVGARIVPGSFSVPSPSASSSRCSSTHQSSAPWASVFMPIRFIYSWWRSIRQSMCHTAHCWEWWQTMTTKKISSHPIVWSVPTPWDSSPSSLSLICRRW